MLKNRTRHSHLAPISYERIAILTVLARESQPKSEIAGEVRADTVGEIEMKTSTLYFLIEELTSNGYIEEKRGYYYLTEKGYRTLNQELKRIERQRLILKSRLHQ